MYDGMFILREYRTKLSLVIFLLHRKSFDQYLEEESRSGQVKTPFVTSVTCSSA